jgi:hypothetical protein
MDIKELREVIKSLDPKIHGALRKALITYYKLLINGSDIDPAQAIRSFVWNGQQYVERNTSNTSNTSNA